MEAQSAVVPELLALEVEVPPAHSARIGRADCGRRGRWVVGVAAACAVMALGTVGAAGALRSGRLVPRSPAGDRSWLQYFIPKAPGGTRGPGTVRKPPTFLELPAVPSVQRPPTPLPAMPTMAPFFPAMPTLPPEVLPSVLQVAPEDIPTPGEETSHGPGNGTVPKALRRVTKIASELETFYRDNYMEDHLHAMTNPMINLKTDIMMGKHISVMALMSHDGGPTLPDIFAMATVTKGVIYLGNTWVPAIKLRSIAESKVRAAAGANGELVRRVAQWASSLGMRTMAGSHTSEDLDAYCRSGELPSGALFISYGELLDLFMNLDMSDDGMLEDWELAAGFQIEIAEAQALLRKFDEDGNTMLDLSEFEQLLRRHPDIMEQLHVEWERKDKSEEVAEDASFQYCSVEYPSEFDDSAVELVSLDVAEVRKKAD